MKEKPSLRQKLIVFAAQRRSRWSRAMTLGARVAVIDGADRVLLVRHTYTPGWILPGGGVEAGETCEDAGIREVREEAGIVATAALTLHGIFANHDNFYGDHLACYLLRDFTREAWAPGREIAAAEFFATDALPDTTTGGSRRRIAEIFSGAKPAKDW